VKTFVKVVGAAAIVATGVGVMAWRARAVEAPIFAQADVTRGDIVETVTSTGELAPTRTVEIGSQVSGRVTFVGADFNSIVKKGQVLVRLDPAILRAKLDSAKAVLDEARIGLEQHQAALAFDQHNLQRTDVMVHDELETPVDHDAALLQVREDEAQITQDEKAIVVAEAQVEQAELNVEHCTITSPIDGVVIERDVDEGQAVSASVNAPKLLVLATNLTSLQLVGDVDEADVAKLYPGEEATFTVDAYPRATFRGVVRSVRLNATATNSVVTYQAVIDAPNPDLRLRPSMTAKIRVDVWRASNVVRVPEAALKFRPTRAVFEALGQTPPEGLRLGAVVGEGEADARPVTAVQKVAGSALVDRMFRPESPLETTGQVYVRDRQGHLNRVSLKLGISDGTWTAVEGGDLAVGTSVVTAVLLPNQPSTAGAAGNNPLMPRPFGRYRPGFGR
jgi:HlyD family secretion protein